MSEAQQKPNLQMGMTDPYIDEKITHVAEMDEEAFSQEVQSNTLLLFILGVFFFMLFHASV